jgi:predicted nucleotidyltransferase
MIAVTEEVLQEMVRAIVREVDPERIYLFGSYARGDAGPDSDVDLLVVERERFGPQRDRLAEITRVRHSLSAFRVAKDILVFSAEEFAYWKDSLNHIIARCLREGRPLYVRP